MTPDTTPPPASPEELEAEARIYDTHGNYLLARQLIQRAQQLRKERGET